MVYPGRPVLEVLPQFRGTTSSRQTPEQRQQLLAFVATEYPASRSLRELAELTGRSQTAIRRTLDQAGVPRRGRGAQAATTRPTMESGQGPRPHGAGP